MEMRQFNYFINDLKLTWAMLAKMELIIRAGKGQNQSGIKMNDSRNIFKEFPVKPQRKMLQSVHYHDKVRRYGKPRFQLVKFGAHIKCAKLCVDGFDPETGECN